jgi:hypothetical protein
MASFREKLIDHFSKKQKSMDDIEDISDFSSENDDEILVFATPSHSQEDHSIRDYNRIMDFGLYYDCELESESDIEMDNIR